MVQAAVGADRGAIGPWPSLLLHPYAFPAAGLGAGVLALVVAAAGRAAAPDLEVIVLALWLAAPVAAAALAERGRPRLVGAPLAALGAAPVAALAAGYRLYGHRPSPAEIVAAPLAMIVLTATVGIVALVWHQHGADRWGVSAWLLAAIATLAAVWAPLEVRLPLALTAGFGVLVALASIGITFTALHPGVDVGLLRLAALAAGTAGLLAAQIGVVMLTARFDFPGPDGAAPAVALLLGLALVPVVSAARRGLGVRLFGTSTDPAVVLTALYRHVPVAGDPDVVLNNVLATVARSVRSRRATLVPGSVDPQEVAPECAVVPLVAEGACIATLIVDPRRSGEGFSRRDARRLESLAPAVTSIAQVALLARALESARREMGSLREVERRRLHHDLHDSLGPLLAGLALSTAALRRLLGARGGTPGDELRHQVDDLARTVAACQAEARRLVNGLGPAAVAKAPLADALADLVAGWSSALAGEGLHLQLDVETDHGHITDAAASAAYPIAAEALTNVVRHASAGQCHVSMAVENGQLRLRVTDDGVGVDTTQSGVGLKSMTERALEIGGTLTVTPLDDRVPPGSPGRGTVVEALLPSRSP